MFVKSITAVVSAHASAPPSSVQASAAGFRANNFAIPTPMAQAITWLKRALRGCANGESIAQNWITAAAPCEGQIRAL